MSVKEEMNSDIDLVPSKWSRRTVADGEWLQKNTIDKLSARDNFLADKIDDNISNISTISGNTLSISGDVNDISAAVSGINSFTGVTTDESISGDGLNNPIGVIDKPVIITAGIDLSANGKLIGVNTNGVVANSAEMSFVAGSGTYASGIGAAAFGINTSAIGSASHAEGSGTIAQGEATHTEGKFTNAIGEASHAEGCSAIASGTYSHAEGYLTNANGNWSHAEGQNTSANGSWTHAEGYKTQAKGNEAHTEGYETIATGEAAHAEGKYTSGAGNESHAEGYSALALGEASHAEGQWTSAIGPRTHTEGQETSAYGETSHAEGYKTSAVGGRSHSEGQMTVASGSESHAEGYQTLAGGNDSHAEGWRTSALGNNSHAGGGYSIAGDANSFACGKYNSTSANAAFVVGNGTSTAARSDAFIVYWDGSVSAAGKISANGVELDGTPNNATISLVGNGIKSSTDNSFTVNAALNKSIDISLLQVGVVDSDNWTKSKDNYNPILSVTFGTSGTYKRYRCLLIAHPDNNGDGQDELVEVYLGIAGTPNQLDYKRISILTNPVPTSNVSSLLNTNYYKFGYTWDDTTGTVTLWIKCNVDSSGNRRKTFFLLKANGELENVNYHPQTTTSTTEPQEFTELDIVCYEQTLTAGTDLKIADNVISVNTDGTATSANMAFVAGSGTYATGLASFAEGVGTSAIGNGAHAEGSGTSAANNQSHAEGYKTSAAGNAAHAEGRRNIASGEGSHAEGRATSAMGTHSHTEGSATLASGNAAHAEGADTIAYADAAHAEGWKTSAFGDYSHAEGYSGFISPSSRAAHAGGIYNVIAGEPIATAARGVDYNYVESLTAWNVKPTTQALSLSQMAFDEHAFYPGIESNPTGYSINYKEYSAASGSQVAYGINNTAIGRASMAVGYGNVACAPYSFVAGKGNYTSDYGQFVVGMYCGYKPECTRFAVGVGSADSYRKTGFAVCDTKVVINNYATIEGDLRVTGSISAYDISLLGGIAAGGTVNSVHTFVSEVNPTGYFNSATDYWGPWSSTKRFWYKNMGPAGFNTNWNITVPKHKTAVITPVIGFNRDAEAIVTGCSFALGVTSGANTSAASADVIDLSAATGASLTAGSYIWVHPAFGMTGQNSTEHIAPTFYFMNNTNRTEFYIRIVKMQNASGIHVLSEALNYMII